MLLLPLVLAPLVVLAQVPLPAAPALPPPLGSVGTVVTLPYGSFRGASKSGYNSFLGIPFAQPPIGDLRFRLPVAIKPIAHPELKITNATAYGPSCSQMQATAGMGFNGVGTDAFNAALDQIQASPLYASSVTDSEDCLTVNVVAPKVIPAGGLPVVAWIYGGGFINGGTSSYPGDNIVKRSMSTRSPVVYVSMNYRLNLFGFLASQEIADAGVGNLGLQDQRFALQWIHDNIHLFGGDPTKVTIWGESAGAISVASQLITNGGNTGGLFRGAFMNSGSPIPVGPIAHGQPNFNNVCKLAKCIPGPTALDCLRKVPYVKLKSICDQTPGIFAYQSLALTYLPRVDGIFFKANPQQLVLQGSVAPVPIVTGDCDDEGTLFSLSSANITSEKQKEAWIAQNYLPHASRDELAALAGYYPADPVVGSPYGTGELNQLTPVFKSIASIQGDGVFQGARRFFLNYTTTHDIPSWSFLFKRGKAIPFLGSFHGSDLIEEWYANVNTDFEGIDYLINFVDHLNPNPVSPITSSLLFWPSYTATSKVLMTFVDVSLTNPTLRLIITADDYRKEAMEYIVGLFLKYPL